MIGLFLYLSVRSAAPRANATAWIRLSSPSPDSSSLVTPEALKPVAPGWRGSAYPGLGHVKESHPEGGAKASFSSPPSWVGDPFRRFPGFASRPRIRRKERRSPPEMVTQTEYEYRPSG